MSVQKPIIQQFQCPINHSITELHSWTKYFGPEVISYVLFIILGLPFAPIPPPPPTFSAVLFENDCSFTSIFNTEMGEGKSFEPK